MYQILPLYRQIYYYGIAWLPEETWKRSTFLKRPPKIEKKEQFCPNLAWRTNELIRFIYRSVGDPNVVELSSPAQDEWQLMRAMSLDLKCCPDLCLPGGLSFLSSVLETQFTILFQPLNTPPFVSLCTYHIPNSLNTTAFVSPCTYHSPNS